MSTLPGRRSQRRSFASIPNAGLALRSRRWYRAQARIAPDYAFFTDTQLFLLPEGHRSRPSVVRFDVASGWRIASGLDDTADPTVFTAPDYDTLVDQPTLMGQFDVTRFMVEGKRHDFVANPAGVFSAEKTRTLIGHLTKLAETQSRICHLSTGMDLSSHAST